MRVLIAGGAGLIGSHLVDAHLASGDHVIALDNFLTGRPQNLNDAARHSHFSLLNADLLDPPGELLSTQPDLVYHLASPASPVHYGRKPIETLLVNSAGTFTLLELAASRMARFVFASTSEIYGDPLIHPQTEDYWGNVNPVGPRSCYDEAKRFAEALTMAYGRSRGVDVRIARIFNTYGPRSDPNDGRLIPNLVVQALRGDPLTIYGDGSQTRSFCFVADMVEGLRRLMVTPGLAGTVVNLGSTDERTVLEIADTILTITGSSSSVEHAPLPVDDPTRRLPRIERAEGLLGWAPTTRFDDGLRQTVSYFRSELFPEKAANIGAGAGTAGDATHTSTPT
jgi:nucleoside-diphosphate-sugar epimerase